jgi:hypothetical protein
MTEFQSNTTNGPPVDTSPYADEEIPRTESHFPPIPSHLSVATSTVTLSPLSDYVSCTKSYSTLENQATDAVPKSTIPVTTTDEHQTSTIDIPTPENATGIEEFNENHTKAIKSPIPEHFQWSDDAELLPAPPKIPMNYSRDLSSLRSSSANPFSSLRRRQRQSRNPRCYTHSQQQHHCYHSFPTPYHYPSVSNPSRHLSQPSFTASLNWDLDPRLSDLSRSLKALGWIRA